MPAEHPSPDAPDEDANLPQRYLARRRRKRTAKKARLAAMSRRRRVLRRVLLLGTWFLGLVAALLVATIVLFYSLTDIRRPDQLPLPQVATIQYADGSTLAKIGSVDRTIVKLARVPEHVRWAVLAAEDRGFYTEPGVSIRGTLRAAVSDITGGNTQGGSGITQQYVKNAYLDNSQTLSRKLKELMIAMKLARQYPKDTILEYYLNTVYFGRNAYGIEAASQAYFGVPVDKLTVAQGAMLAGVLRAPGYYDPASNRIAAMQRWQYVVDGMVSTKHLTQAQATSLRFPKTKPIDTNKLGASGWKFLLVNAVLADLQAHGVSAEQVSLRGLTIRTTIQRKAQDAALQAIRTTFKGLTKKQRNLKNALVAVDPASGGILAYYAGSGPDAKGYDGKVDYNDYATRGTRPPGSSFKPYVLATALGQTLKQAKNRPHYAINSSIDGSYCRKIEGTKICNDPGDSNVSGPNVKVADAMKYSLNTSFDLMASQVGPSNVAGTAYALGVAKKNMDGSPQLVDKNGSTTFGIGIGDYAVSVADQANGFATLAGKGKYHERYLVQSAVSSQGDLVYKHKDSNNQAVDPKVANDVTLTLKPIAAYSGGGLSLAGGRASAAKTGTEGLPGTGTNNSDAWMVGFTPQVSAAVWVGTGRSVPIYNAAGQPEYGSDLPGKTWKLFMDTYLQGKPQLALPDKQEISSTGNAPKATPTPTRTTSAAATSKTPKPTFSISTGFSTPTPSPTPTPSVSTPTPTPTPTPSTSSVSVPAGCGGVLQPPCRTSTSPGG